MIRIGIDMGGTKIAAAALNDKGEEMYARRTYTPSDYPGILKSCAGLVQAIEKEAGQKAMVGLCSPGAIDMKQGMVVISPNIHALNGKFFARDLEAACGAKVRIANDAACFALSESVDGAGKDARSVYGVILGTGVGGALVVDKKAPSGPNGVVEWGHVPLPWQEREDVPERCGCGRVGDIESYLSGPALHRQLQRRLGRPCSKEGLQEGIAARDPDILWVMDRYCLRLAKALTMLVTVIDPDVIVLGGGLSNIDMIYTEVTKKMPALSITGQVKTPIARAKYGDDSGIRGAAWLWPRDL